MPVGDVFLATGPFLFAELEFSPVGCELGFAEFCLFDCICFHRKSICKHSGKILSIELSNKTFSLKVFFMHRNHYIIGISSNN